MSVHFFRSGNDRYLYLGLEFIDICLDLAFTDNLIGQEIIDI